MEAKIAALFSLLAVIILVHTLLLQPPRLTGRPGALAALVTDRLLSTLDLRFDARRLVELVNRRNMILLCHAILLLVLRDAGILASPARRRRRSCSSDTTTSASAAAGDRPLVVRNSRTADHASDTTTATVADGGRFKRERRSPQSCKATARARRRLPLARAAPRHDADIQGIHLVAKQSSEFCSKFDHAVGEEIAVVVEEDKSARSHFEQIAAEERSRGEEETEAECADDVDEMNKRFDEFISSMRMKMQLESLQLVKVKREKMAYKWNVLTT